MDKSEQRRDISAKVLLMWAKQLSTPFSVLSLNITREVCEYLGITGSLADLSCNSIRFFQHEPQLWTSPSSYSTIHIDQASSRWLILTDSNVFCCGGVHNFSNTTIYFSSTYLLEGNGSVKSFPSMISPRAFHGLIEWRKQVLAFGGRGRSANSTSASRLNSVLLTQSEIYQRGGVVGWQALAPARHGRCSFNPCLYREVVYLCGYGSSAMEVFSPWLNSMTVLDCLLPEPSSCCLYVLGEVLFVHSDHYILKYRSRRSKVIEVGRTQIKRGIAKWQNSQPVTSPANSLVYCARAGECWTFHMLTGLPGPSFS